MHLRAFGHALLRPRGRRAAGITRTMLVMNLTAILLTAAAIQVSAAGRAQTVTYSAHAAPLKTVLTAIEKQTGYVFFYDPADLQDAPAVTVDLRQEPLLRALDKVLPARLQYTIEGNTIMLTAKVAVAPAVAAAPPGEVHGRVVDSVGMPLEGVNVSIKGTKKGTVTGANGEFVLKDVPADAELVFSSVGYKVRVIKLAGKQDIRVEMYTASQSLVDAVVYKGYYSTTERLNTGDVTTVKGETIQQQPVSDPILALEGQVPGLNIQQASGVAGAYSSITIRGLNSIANGNDPLYIVDGVPFGSASLTNSAIGGGVVGKPNSFEASNMVGTGVGGTGLSPFNNLNPADIESIVVLKDADATAIYGSRGANGVILITTRKGKAGKTRFDLNVFSGTGKVTRTLDLLNTPQYLAMRREAFANDGLSVPSIAVNPTNNNYDINGVWDTTRYTNWQKVFIGNAAGFTNAQGNLSGGNVNTQFSISGGYSKQGTVFPGNYSDQKGMAHFNLTHSSENGKFHANLTTSYVNDNSDLPDINFTKYITLAPDAPALYLTNGNINWQLLNGSATFKNPISYTLQHANAISRNLISHLDVSYDIVPGLQIKSGFGYNNAEMNQLQLFPATAYAPPNNTNPNLRANYYATTQSQTWIIEPQLDFKRGFGFGRLEALVGSTFENNNVNSSSGESYGFASDALISDPAAASTNVPFGYNNTQYRYNAIYGRINYNWEDKYLLNLTARRDGSSRFGPGKQFGNFGAAGIGWIFSKEGFFANNLPWLSFGKIRASYGITGSDQISPYQYLSTYTPSSSTYQNVAALAPTQLANPYFAWEVDKKLEGGIELGFLKDRILITGSFYRNRTGNQLVGYPLPTLTGFNTVQYNLPAVLQNTGTELVLNTVNIKTGKFSWTSSLNLSIPNNKLVAYPNIQGSVYEYAYVVGKSIFIRELYHSTGVNPQTGIYSFETKNANGLPSYPQDLYATKPITQKYYGGFDNKFTYKGFQLDIFIQFVNQLGYNYIDYVSAPGIVNNNEPTAVLSRWRYLGNLTNIQRFSTTISTEDIIYNYFDQSDGIVTNASFMRLKNLALSYEIPVSWKKSMLLQTLRLYLQCQNLFTITHYLGLDPETQGINLPPLRMITGGVQLSL
jgi:TonB-linked SusC/RagA family outer membrane protein